MVCGYARAIELYVCVPEVTDCLDSCPDCTGVSEIIPIVGCNIPLDLVSCGSDAPQESDLLPFHVDVVAGQPLRDETLDFYEILLVTADRKRTFSVCLAPDGKIVREEK